MTTDFGTVLQLFRLRKRLRALQKTYYLTPTKEEAIIPEYFSALAAIRELAVPPSGERRLHLGCGGHRIEGWINVDISSSPAIDLQANLAGYFPFRNDSIDFIHSEDLIEHLDLKAGRHLLAECFRVLSPGGVMRLLTPDLRRLVRRIYLRPHPPHLAWCQARLQAGTPCEALNMHCRMGGEHRFIYDFPYLKTILTVLGFHVRQVSWNRSRYPVLRYLDLRDFGLNLFVEATKPDTA